MKRVSSNKMCDFNINKARLNRQPCLHFNDHRLLMGFAAWRTRSKAEAAELHWLQLQLHFHQRFPSFLPLFFWVRLAPAMNLQRGFPCGLICSTRAWKRKLEAFAGLSSAVSEKNTKRGTWMVAIRSPSQPLALGDLVLAGKPTALYLSFFKVLIDRALYFITRLARWPPPSPRYCMPKSGVWPVEARLTCWLRQNIFFCLNQEIPVWFAMVIKRGEVELEKTLKKKIKFCGFLAASE